MNRWTERREGEAIGHLARHPGATAEDIAERYKRDPKQVLQTLWDLDAAGEVSHVRTAVPGLLGTTFPALQWTLTPNGRP